MKKTIALIASLTVLLMGVSMTSLGSGELSGFVETEYYILSLGGLTVDVASVVDTAQTNGFTVIRYDGGTATAYRGKTETTEPLSELEKSNKLLIVDNERIYLRVKDDAYTYTVRPSASGYELVIDPQQTLPIVETLTSILTALQGMGLVGTEVDLGFHAFSKSDLKGPMPPEGARIDSDLYWLTVAEDWFAFAATKGLSLTGLRVEVVAEKLPGGSIPTEFSAYVLSETETAAKLLLPIDTLVRLAESAGVGLVRPPYRPAAP